MDPIPRPLPRSTPYLVTTRLYIVFMPTANCPNLGGHIPKIQHIVLKEAQRLYSHPATAAIPRPLAHSTPYLVSTRLTMVSVPTSNRANLGGRIPKIQYLVLEEAQRLYSHPATVGAGEEQDEFERRLLLIRRRRMMSKPNEDSWAKCILLQFGGAVPEKRQLLVRVVVGQGVPVMALHCARRALFHRTLSDYDLYDSLLRSAKGM